VVEYSNCHVSLIYAVYFGGGREGGIGNEKFGATTYLTFLIKY
jgi:hypothetical protein